MYPIGAETVLPGLTPAAGQTMFAEFNTTYNANSFLDGQGHSSVPGFKLSVYAFAPKITHNWGVHLLGGDLVSWVAVPFVYEWCGPPLAGTRRRVSPMPSWAPTSPITAATGIGGTDSMWSRRPPYITRVARSISGNTTLLRRPSGAFTYLPHHGKTEISSRLQYIVNYTDSATHYHSGNEFLWEYVAMQNVTKKLAIGANGYFYQQTTADRLLGVIYAGGKSGTRLRHRPRGALSTRSPWF